MLTYKIHVELSNGKTLDFEVSAKNEEQARKFGINTARQICSSRGTPFKIKSINVEEFYEDFN